MKNKSNLFEIMLLTLLPLLITQNTIAQDTIYVFENTNTFNYRIDELINDGYQFYSIDSCLKIKTEAKKTYIYVSVTDTFSIYAIRGNDTISFDVISIPLPELQIEFSPLSQRRGYFRHVDSLIIEGFPIFEIIYFRMSFYLDFRYYVNDTLITQRLIFLNTTNQSKYLSEYNKQILNDIAQDARVVFYDIYIRYKNSYFIIEKTKTMYINYH